MNIDEIRNLILAAREKRASLRRQLSPVGCGAISLSLNMPGYPKTTPLLSDLFDEVRLECQQYLQANRVTLDVAREVRQADAAGDFYLAPFSDRRPPGAIKALAEAFEMHHPLGRIIDIDISDREGQPVSSGKLKQCLLCEKPAVVCMREVSHDYEELRAHITRESRRYLMGKAEKQMCRQLAALALKAILYEISASPKPGLVGRFEQGAHHDMDYFTFIDSTSVLAGYFEELALSGSRFDGPDLRDALPIIRAIGLKMESAMFAETRGVNTQKGLIFLIGLALFSAARCIAQDGVFSAVRFRDTIAAICANLVENELAAPPGEETTHGILCYRRYGSVGAGVRKEAEDGLPSVLDQGLPELTAALAAAGADAAAAHINKALIKTLLRLMTVVSDSNILYRKDLETLNQVRRMAQTVLEAADEAAGDVSFRELLDYCCREHISPGGSADLLAITVFVYFVERAFSSPSRHGKQDRHYGNV